MSRLQALQHLGRSARRLAAGENCTFVPARLLSNSQASTSAASAGQDRGGRQTERNASSNWLPQESQASRDTRSQAEPRPASGLDGGPSSRRNDSSKQSNSQSTPEFEPGFVANGPYPYAANEVDVTNLAGSTETAWEFLGSVDEQCVTWFGMDFSRGTLPEVERNALLSNEAKEMMYQMHKHDDKR